MQSAARRGVKRKRPARKTSPTSVEHGEHVLSHGTHPSGLKPLGNLLYDSMQPGFRECRTDGLGLLSQLDDETLVLIFETLADVDLARLGRVSRALYAWSYHDDLWRPLVIGRFGGTFEFEGTWRATYAHMLRPDAYVEPRPVRLEGFYSDFLFQSWICASVGFDAWTHTENIDRRSNLSLEEFIAEYEQPNRPVIITDAIASWPALTTWSKDSLLERYADVAFRAEAVDIKLCDYFLYADRTREESPLYLFDKAFAEHAPQLATEYKVPAYFAEDLFSVLGPERPDYRWLIAGPARSGSTFHKDPNATSAWNAVVTGSKKWVMFPPDCPPPGIFPSADGSEVTAPVSLVEWFVNFYPQCRLGPIKPIEGVCRAGETIFVPSGWWHAVLNLDDSIAITQNYVSRRNLLAVLCFLRDKASQVSGCDDKANLFQKFDCAFRAAFPGEIEELERREAQRERDSMSAWQRMQEEAAGEQFSFGFGFGTGDGDEADDDDDVTDANADANANSDANVDAEANADDNDVPKRSRRNSSCSLSQTTAATVEV
eukprot:TRINITY_DN9122_c0_g1_i1.p1 TRINITY_DN9122_c0_g1~~TRINITY_DN9122_c0_g1_i1.p1  ORF type:complete len:544 (-),score=183.17 TRINITY_DN9122_c0_g1_i1:210-1841(-)